MQELKFRAYIKPLKRYATGLDTIQFHKCYDVAGAGIWTVVTVNEGIFEGDDIIVEQGTGLKDENGKEIYVGDIVRAEDSGHYLVGSVEWNEDYAKCEVIYDQITGNSFEFEGDDGYPVANSCEVIGNIHENQELLDEEE